MTVVTTSRPSRVLPPKALLLALLAQVPLVVFRWPPTFRWPWVLAGVLVLTAGLALNFGSDRLFRRSNVGVCPFSPAAMLVQEGLYGFTRNPMYFGMILVAAAPALLLGVPANLFAAVLFALWLHWRFVKPEEAYLFVLFGEAYDSYRNRVPRWIGVKGSWR